MKTKLIVIVIAIFLLAFALPVYAENEYEAVEAKIVTDNGIKHVEQEDGIVQEIQYIKVRILDGEYEDEEYDMEYIISEDITHIASNSKLKEDDRILVSIEEKEGEVIGINYKETINSNYISWVVLAVLILLVLIIGRTKVIKAIIVYLITIISVCGVYAFAIRSSWDLILISSIVSAIITLVVSIKVNGVDKKAVAMIICSIIGCVISGILMYILFDIMKFNNINIKIAEGVINVKEIFCSLSILFGGILSNIIILSSFNMFMFLNKTYKRKSDNIIEGQRSLKL